MAEWLTQHGHSVEVFAIERVDAPEFQLRSTQQDGFTVHRLDYSVKGVGRSFRNLYEHPLVSHALAQVLSRQSFDLMHVISGYLLGVQAVETACEFRLPVAISLMEYWFLCKQLNLLRPAGDLCTGPESDMKCTRCIMEEKRRYRWPAQAAPGAMELYWRVAGHLPVMRQTLRSVSDRRMKLKQTLEAADLVVCNSRFLLNKFAEYGFDVSRYRFIRQGVEHVEDRAIRRRPKGNFLRLGYIGQIKRHKGVDLLIDAVVGILDSGHGVSLDLWGVETEEPNYVSDLKCRTKSHAGIRWNGPFPGSRIWEVLNGIDALVMPSRWYENSPNVILEAQAMKLPVVAAHLGGMAELIQGGGGLTFIPDDWRDLRSQLLRLLNEPGLLEQLCAEIPSARTIDEEMEELLDAYRQLRPHCGSGAAIDSGAAAASGLRGAGSLDHLTNGKRPMWRNVATHPKDLSQ